MRVEAVRTGNPSFRRGQAFFRIVYRIGRVPARLIAVTTIVEFRGAADMFSDG
jgi:hypothetical protein